MADNVEIIGGVGVSITGDYSSLATAFADAQSKAEQAGKDTADAFNQGVAGVSDAADVVTGALSGIAPAGDQAAAGLTNYSDAAQSAGASSQEAESHLAQMADQLTAIGEALAITEGLREFGREALSASDSITRADIALSTMTGDGEKARATIEDLEALGIQDGLAMPSLLTAAQRMTAMLPPGTDVVALLGHIADGAAAMGTDIESAANRFDMLVNAGTLSARALTSMGLSLQSVTDALNKVDPAADATTQTVAAMFKAMDPGQRVEVLQTALEGLGGTAQKVAEQTFGGQWQQLADAWEKIMVQVGQALLPVISDLTDFLKLDVAPFIQSVVEAFRALPAPLQDGAVALGLVAAALVPLTGALAAGGLAVNALSGLLPALNAALAATGLAAAETATAETAETAATTAMGAAAQTASGEMTATGAAATGLGSIIAGTLAAALVAGVALWADYRTKMDAAHESVKNIAAEFDQWISKQVSSAQTTAQLQAAQQKLDDAFANGLITAKEYNTLLAQLDATSKSLLSTYAATLPHITVLTDEHKKATDQVTLLKQALADAQANLDKVSASYQTGASSATQLMAAQKGVTSAQDALNAALGPTPDTMDAINQQTASLVDGTGKLATSDEVAAAQAQAHADKLTQLSQSLITAQEKLVLTQKATNDLAAAVTAGTAKQSDYIAMLGHLESASDAATAAQKKLDDATVAYANDALTKTDAANKVVLADLEAMEQALGPTVSAFMGLQGAVEATAAALPNFGVQMSTISTGPLAGLQNALDEAKAKVAALSEKMADGANVGQQYEQALKRELQAQVALDQETAVMATGLQGATDALSLATVAVAAAQAKVDDLTAAYANGVTTYTEVQHAQTELTRAQQELNKATADASPLIEGESNDLNGLLVPAMGAAETAVTRTATAVNSSTTALKQNAAAWQDVASAAGNASTAIQQDINQFSQAFGGGTSAGGSIGGAPAGFQWSAGGGFMTNRTLNLVARPDATPAELARFTGTTPGAILAEAGFPDNPSLYNTPMNQIAAQGGGSTAGSTAGAGGGGGTFGAAGGQTNTIRIGGPITTGTIGPGTTVSASGAGAGSSSTAVNGGTYPDVTAHQAAGEVWAVSLSSGGTVAGGVVSAPAALNQTISSTVNQTISGGGASEQAMQGVIQALTVNGVDMLQLANQVGAMASATQAAVTKSIGVPGAVQTILPAGSVTSTGLPGYVGSSGSAGGAVPITNLFPGATGFSPTTATGPAYGANLSGFNPLTGATQIVGAPAGSYVPPSAPFYGPGSAPPGSQQVNAQVSINMSNSNFGANPAQMQQAITQSVTNGLVAALRTAGARF